MTRAQAAVIVALRQGQGPVAEVIDRCVTTIPRHALREAVGQLVHGGHVIICDDLRTIKLPPGEWL